MTVTSPWWQQWEGFPVLNCFSARQGLGVLVLNVRYTATAMDWNDTVQPGSAQTQSISEATMAVPSQTLPVQPLALSLSFALFVRAVAVCLSVSGGVALVVVAIAASFFLFAWLTVLVPFWACFSALFISLRTAIPPPNKKRQQHGEKEKNGEARPEKKKKTKRASAHARNGPDGSRIRHGSFP